MKLEVKVVGRVRFEVEEVKIVHVSADERLQASECGVGYAGHYRRRRTDGSSRRRGRLAAGVEIERS